MVLRLMREEEGSEYGFEYEEEDDGFEGYDFENDDFEGSDSILKMKVYTR